MGKLKEWAKAASVRALKTFAQTFASLITVGVAISDIEWSYVASVAFVAAVYSIATSLAGIPEVDDGESVRSIVKED